MSDANRADPVRDGEFPRCAYPLVLRQAVASSRRRHPERQTGPGGGGGLRDGYLGAGFCAAPRRPGPQFPATPRLGIRAPFEVPDEAMMAMALDTTRPVPTGTIQYPAAFGV